MSDPKNTDSQDKKKENIDEEFEIVWNNWSSRRKCESTHQKEHIQDFKKKFNSPS